MMKIRKEAQTPKADPYASQRMDCHRLLMHIFNFRPEAAPLVDAAIGEVVFGPKGQRSKLAEAYRWVLRLTRKRDDLKEFYNPSHRVL